VADGINWSNLPSDISDVWMAALEDAQLSHDEAVLLLHPVLPADGQLAVYLGIDRYVTPELPDAVLADLARLREQFSGRHIVMLMTEDRPIEMDAALVRHELQHARQLAADACLWGLAELCEDVVRHALKGSGRLYNQIPTEQDANAAAHAFAVNRFGAVRVAEVAKLVGDAPALRGDALAISTQDLPDRMVEFLATIPDLCRSYATAGMAIGDVDQCFASFVEMAAGRGHGARWLELSRHATLSPE
jgi:hypothetical protein